MNHSQPDTLNNTSPVLLILPRLSPSPFPSFIHALHLSIRPHVMTIADKAQVEK